MDVHYNFEGAAGALHKIIQDNQENAPHQLLQFNKEDPPKIQGFEQPRAWRMLDTSATTEVAFRIQGILCHKDLPPFTKHFGKHSPKLLHLSQSVHLTGLGCPDFDNITDTIIDVHELFSRQFPEGAMQTPVPSRFMQFPKVEAATRYFTHRKSNPNGESLQLPNDVDPQGILVSNMGADMYHGIDNQVQYFTVVRDESEGRNYTFSYTKAPPTCFKIGDIVEAQILFVAVPIQQNQIKLITQFQSLALLDATFSKEAYNNRVRAVAKPSTLAAPKRKIGYDEQDSKVASTTRKMRKLSIHSVASNGTNGPAMDTMS